MDTIDHELFTPTQGEPAGTTLAGLFTDYEAAHRTITELSAAGMTEEQITVAALDRKDQGHLVDETDAQALTNNSVATGAFGGRLVEGVARLLAGGRGAANIVYTSLIRMGFTEDQARYYEAGYEQGKVLVAVEGSIFIERAREILVRNGAELGPVSTRPFMSNESGLASSGSTPPSTGPTGLNRTEL